MLNKQQEDPDGQSNNDTSPIEARNTTNHPTLPPLHRCRLADQDECVVEDVRPRERTNQKHHHEPDDDHHKDWKTGMDVSLLDGVHGGNLLMTMGLLSFEPWR